MKFECGFFHEKKRPFVIAGPCSAETEEQLIQTAREIAEIDSVRVFRAGVWKPRTRPGAFEGQGEQALEWMKLVKSETGLHTATEIATPRHAEKALKAGIDVLWIGARTTGNPLYVQELANALKGTDIKLMIKNPLHPDIDLWCGAIQRFHKAGINNIAAVHRGFYPYEKTAFRNLPLWEMPIELQRRNDNLPVFCDPSHIAGKSNHVASISQQAMDLNMSGLMIEVHNKPQQALTDKHQQLSPGQLTALLEKLEIRKRKFRDQAYRERIDKYRTDIDSLDFQLLDLLSQRQKLVKDIAGCKREMNVSILQLKRWEGILKTRLAYAEQNGLSRDFILNILQWIHKEAIRIQTEIMQKPDSRENE